MDVNMTAGKKLSPEKKALPTPSKILHKMAALKIKAEMTDNVKKAKNNFVLIVIIKL